MTRLGAGNTWMVALGFLALGVAGCPRQDFQLGVDGAGSGGRGGTGGSAAGSGSSAQRCGSRGLPECKDGFFCSYPVSASCGETDEPGVCKAQREACTREYAPVCGCDGETYSNTCVAESAGVSVRQRGECKPSSGKVCGGLRGGQCASDEYCNYPIDAICGAADATGVCTTKPQACREIYQPVCGCDGATYGNECEAATMGTSVASEGPCTPPGGGDSCGGGLTGAQCQADEYCDYPIDAICGAADALGVCRPKPSVCTFEYAPVCGCDGQTYSTACAAASEGQSVARTGECENPGGDVCGVRGAAECAADQYCQFPVAAQCGAADEPGKCTKRPDACTLQLAEVCGCDGQTYGNDCLAATSGSSVAHAGACEPQACGGIAGIQCPNNQYCNYPVSASCGAADQTGVCAELGTACTKEYRPVCGCDGMTYGNACTAGAAGQSIASEGECVGGNSAGEVCGGLAGLACSGGNYCNYPVSAQCGAADQTGVCAEVRTACTREYRPVCGCDDVTYANPCTAGAAGQSIASEGECAGGNGSGDVCGGIAGLACPDGEYCNYPASAQCGAADQTGSCTNIPNVCTADLRPVCGCDGITYGNACGAAVESVSVVHEGAC